jgi:hypothetical protein
VEVSGFTWHSLEVRLDEKIIVSFPQVTKDSVSSENNLQLNMTAFCLYFLFAADSSCIFWKLCKRRRRLANEFLNKLILG